MSLHFPLLELSSHERQLSYFMTSDHLDESRLKTQENQLIFGHHVEGLHMKQMVPRMNRLLTYDPSPFF